MLASPSQESWGGGGDSEKEWREVRKEEGGSQPESVHRPKRYLVKGLHLNAILRIASFCAPFLTRPGPNQNLQHLGQFWLTCQSQHSMASSRPRPLLWLNAK